MKLTKKEKEALNGKEKVLLENGTIWIDHTNWQTLAETTQTCFCKWHGFWREVIKIRKNVNVDDRVLITKHEEWENKKGKTIRTTSQGEVVFNEDIFEWISNNVGDIDMKEQLFNSLPPIK